MAAVFRLGLVGAGRMGRTHLRALAGSERVRVQAVAEPSPRSRAGLDGTGPALHASLADMLADTALDGVLIAAPTDQHGEIIRAVAAHGLPILCEKPCGMDSAVARAAAQSAAEAGVALQIAYWRRYVPALQALRDRIRDGELGRVELVTCYQWDERPPSAAFRAHSGGIAVDMGVHEFDQLRWLTGQDIASLSAVASAPEQDAQAAGDVDSAQVIVELSGGSCGIISLGRYHPAGDMARVEVFGTRSTVRCDFLNPAEGEREQLAALRRQAEDFAMSASGVVGASGAVGGGGASAADAVAALVAAEQVTAAIPALAGARVAR